MRKLVNAPFILEDTDGAESVKTAASMENVETYFTTILKMLKNPPEGGWNEAGLDIMHVRLSVVAKLKPIMHIADSEVLLEEDEYKKVLEALKLLRWMVTDTAILKFCKWLKEIPQVTIK